MYITRAIEETVVKVSAMFPVMLVTGPRQVRKTTLLQKIADKERKYVTLDDPDVRYLAKHKRNGDIWLAAYLLKWGNPEILEKGAMSGAFFESYVFSEIYKSYLNAGKEPPLFYYRDKDQKKIDLLIYQNGTLFPIEIKKPPHRAKPQLRTLRY